MERQLRTVVFLLLITALLLAALTGMAANKAEARASLRGDLLTPPGSWEPLGFNVTGTAASFVVNNMGWNATTISGNVGIGDGSMGALNSTSNMKELDFTTDQYFMSGDVTTAPWDPARLNNENEPQGNEAGTNETATNNTTAASNETNIAENGGNKVVETGAGNITLTIPRNCMNISYVPPAREHATASGENTNTSEPTSEPPSRTGNIGRPMELNDPYHSILLGRPVNDLMYEGPLAIQGSMYFRLVGLRMPGGTTANVGMRALSYGY